MSLGLAGRLKGGSDEEGGAEEGTLAPQEGVSRPFAVKAASVLGTTKGTDAKGKSVRMFSIKVEPRGGEQWSTAKRFTEFKELEAEMALAGLEVEAKLPKKKLTHGKKTLEKRRLALQRWLDSIAADAV